MTTSVIVHDETTPGHTGNELILEFFTQRVTVRELIRQRVKQEGERFNGGESDLFQGMELNLNASYFRNQIVQPATRL